ncbi:S1 domain-containing protein [Kineococcus auxinigenes]|uniref:cold shock domain-containing protein n=1 Tax=unclassified Kineococcus TaxID=2621656 RepID=UPI003D7E2730
MAVEAVVREWHSEEGWGVVDCPQTPGGCWAHFSHVAITGYRQLHAGQAVALEWEAGDQDGFAYRAVRLWPTDSDPVEPLAEHDSGAYRSTLTLRFDETD